MITTQTLKNAARALGYDLWSDPDGSHYLVDYDGVKLKRWDPEHSSADSFELMVALGMRVYVYPGCGDDCTVVANDETRRLETHIQVSHGSDSRQATRLAILRAAAEVGADICQS